MKEDSDFDENPRRIETRDKKDIAKIPFAYSNIQKHLRENTRERRSASFTSTPILNCATATMVKSGLTRIQRREHWMISLNQRTFSS